MFDKFNLVAGIMALVFFGYIQHQGWNVFDHVADSGKPGSGSSRTYHK